jgi:hypothetical protein
MGHIDLINIFFVFLGLTLNTLLEWIRLEKKERHTFSIKIWYSENKITLLATAIISFLSLYFVDMGLDGLGVYTDDDALFYQAHAFLSGFAPYATLAKVLKIEIPDNRENYEA